MELVNSREESDVKVHDARRYVNVLTSKVERSRQMTAKMTLLIEAYSDLRSVLLGHLDKWRHQRQTSKQHVLCLKQQYQRISDKLTEEQTLKETGNDVTVIDECQTIISDILCHWQTAQTNDTNASKIDDKEYKMLRKMYSILDAFRKTKTVFVDDAVLDNFSTSSQSNVRNKSAKYNTCFKLFENAQNSLTKERNEYDKRVEAFYEDVEMYGKLIMNEDLSRRHLSHEKQQEECLEIRLVYNKWASDVTRLACRRRVHARTMCDEQLSNLLTIEDQYQKLLVNSKSANRECFNWTQKLGSLSVERQEGCARMEEFSKIWENAKNQCGVVNPVAYVKLNADPSNCCALKLRNHEERLRQVTLELDAQSILHETNIAEIISPWKSCYEERSVAAVQEQTWKQHLMDFIIRHQTTCGAETEQTEKLKLSYQNTCSLLKELMSQLYDANDKLQSGAIFEPNSIRSSSRLGSVKDDCTIPEPRMYYDDYIRSVELRFKRIQKADVSFEKFQLNFENLKNSFDVYNITPTNLSACSDRFVIEQRNANFLIDEFPQAHSQLDEFKQKFILRKDKVNRVKQILNSMKEGLVDECMDNLIPKIINGISEIESKTEIVKDNFTALKSFSQNRANVLHKWNDEKQFESCSQSIKLLGCEDETLKAFRDRRNPALNEYGCLVREHMQKLNSANMFYESLINSVLDERFRYASELDLLQHLETSLINYQERVREWTEYQNDLRYQQIPMLENLLWTQFEAVAEHFPHIDPFCRENTKLEDTNSTRGDVGVSYDEFYFQKFSQNCTDVRNCFRLTTNCVEELCVSLARYGDTFLTYVEQKAATQQIGANLEEFISSALDIAQEIRSKLDNRGEFLNGFLQDYQEV